MIIDIKYIYILEVCIAN